MVGLIYAAVEDSSLWRTFLERFVAHLRCNMGTFSIASFRQPAFTLNTVVGVSEEEYEDYNNGTWKGKDPWLPAAAKCMPMPAGTMRMSQDFCPDAELEQTEVYQQYLGRRGLHYGGGVVLASSASQASLMTVLRPKELGPLSQAEQSYWRDFVPHLVRAVRLIGEQVRLRSERDLLYAAMNDAHSGMVLLNQSGEILLTNQTAERLLDAGEGVWRDNGILRASSVEDNQQVQKALEAAGNADGCGWTQRLKISRGRARPPLMLMAWMVPAGQDQFHGQPIMVRMVDPDAQPPLDEAALRELYLLTKAEAHLACSLASGITLEQAAESGHVSINTMRTHLARVFSKMGVRQQSQLVSLVLLTAAKHS